jgi:hypothetical protein
MEGHLVVVLVDLIEEAAERRQLNAELGGKVQVKVHLLQQQEDLLVLPLVAVKRGLAKVLTHFLRDGHITASTTMALLTSIFL